MHWKSSVVCEMAAILSRLQCVNKITQQGFLYNTAYDAQITICRGNKAPTNWITIRKNIWNVCI